MNVPQAIRTGSLSRAAASPQTRSTSCLNCCTSLTGPFCSSCGQRDIPPYPSVRELAVDAFWELSGWDGRFASTARALFRHPGMLTREFLEGRRARYISPLRLYLVASLVYFVLAASAPNIRLESGKTVLLGVRGGAPAGAAVTRPERVANVAESSPQGEQALTQEERTEALEDVARAPALMQPFLRRAVEDPGGFRRGLLEAMPRMLFALLPVFAAIVALFYRGRKYPEHFYFAIHLHAFVFLALAVAEAMKLTRAPALSVTTGVLSLLSIPVYTTLAFRHVYGGSLLRTLAKEAAIGTIYGFVSSAALAVVVYWVSVAR